MRRKGTKRHNQAMHAELAAVPDSLYHITRANPVIAVVLSQDRYEIPHFTP
jgi:hypothetical protein